MKISLKNLGRKIKGSSLWLKLVARLGIFGWLIFILVVLFIAFTTYQGVYRVIISEPDTSLVVEDVQRLQLKKDEFERVKAEINARQRRIYTETAKEFINPFSPY